MQKIRLFHLLIFWDKSIFESHDQTGHTHFWPFKPKKNWSAFNFCESVLTCKKSIILSVHSSDTDTILEPCHKTGPHPFLTMPTPKIFKHLFICMNLYQHAKNQLIPSIHSRDTVNFRVLWTDWPHPFLTISTQKIFDQLLIYVH